MDHIVFLCILRQFPNVILQRFRISSAPFFRNILSQFLPVLSIDTGMRLREALEPLCRKRKVGDKRYDVAHCIVHGIVDYGLWHVAAGHRYSVGFALWQFSVPEACIMYCVFVREGTVMF
jgi:hypothetical protein